MAEEGKNELEKRIIEVFDAFDHAGEKTVDVREVGTLIRSLGCCPSELDLQEIIAEVEDKEASGSVTLEKFLQCMVRLVEENKLQPAEPEELLKAFQMLDPEKRGYITKEEMTKYMLEEGEPFTQEEVDEMMGVAVDSETGNIPYEYYINQLMVSKELYQLKRDAVEKVEARPSRKSFRDPLLRRSIQGSGTF
ncbi:hypothetical protein R5R35_008662 [Gryllus longicercus]|uniref:EF-hand domain-containing protein n=1 Tax=Gryllus longicercus TaxID=2509291 RepID=A0AAN9YZH7_9ORTH